MAQIFLGKFAFYSPKNKSKLSGPYIDIKQLLIV